MNAPSDILAPSVRDRPRLVAILALFQLTLPILCGVFMVVTKVDSRGLLLTSILGGLVCILGSAIAIRCDNTALANEKAKLLHDLEQHSAALLRTRNAIVFGLAKLAESRDDDTGEHLERIRKYVEILARELACRIPGFGAERIELLGAASSLHDIGKVGIPDSVLLKPDRLNDEERAIMARHTLIGGDCLMALRARLPGDTFLDIACEIAFAHHEHWDGSGYPFGLVGDNIPLAARLVALADVYDALTTKRVYKPAYSHEHASRVICDASGKQFDPIIVEAFKARADEFRAVATQHSDVATPISIRHGAPLPIDISDVERISARDAYASANARDSLNTAPLAELR